MCVCVCVCVCVYFVYMYILYLDLDWKDTLPVTKSASVSDMTTTRRKFKAAVEKVED